MSIPPHMFWQDLHPPGGLSPDPPPGVWAAALPDRREIALPIRVLPGDGTQAVASLILNQASFAVLDAIADALAAALRPNAPDIVAGLPTLGLPLAEGVARRLGHDRFVALSTSAKFWYDRALSVPVSSITSPGAGKRLYLDPRMIPVLRGARIALVDDVLGTGRTLAAALDLLAAADLSPVLLGVGMVQGAARAPDLARVFAASDIRAALRTPRLVKAPGGHWRPEPGAVPAGTRPNRPGPA